MAKIFVFGSNLAGIHGAGAAKYARQHKGAILGQGEGMQGESYGIPTKDAELKVLPLEVIKQHVDKFLDFARMNPNIEFEVSAIGTGLAGYTSEQIAPMFAGAPKNCSMPAGWWPILDRKEVDL